MKSYQKIRIETEDLILRTVTENDIYEVSRMYDYPNTIPVKKAKKVIDNMVSNYCQNKVGCIKHFCLAVCLKDSEDDIIGWVGLDGEAEKDRVVIFYIIAEKQRNKGYATQAAKAILQCAFDYFQLNSIYGGCNKNNIASFKIMRNIGMQQYGVDDNGSPQFRIDRHDYII